MTSASETQWLRVEIAMGMGAGVLDRLVKENLGHVSTFTDRERKKGLDRGRTRETETESGSLVCL